jgi:hypothetical protein
LLHIQKIMKTILVLAWLAILLCGISYMFWHNEVKYSLPTPVPKTYHSVQPGAHIDIVSSLIADDSKPKFIHFFNPSCPCSRFNMKHFKSLVRAYGDRVSFAMVVLNKDKKFTAKEVQEDYDLDIPVSFDPSIAIDCGVYSTPQAVLLDANSDLYYRGNYNKSRYCTDKNTNYAQMAIDTLLSQKPQPKYDRYAVTAYGCSLSYCTTK